MTAKLMAKLMLCLDGEQKKFVVEGTGDVTNVEILSVSLPDTHPQHATIVIRLATPAECDASEKLRLAVIERKVSSDLGTAKCQMTLATSGFDQKEGRRTAENILKQQAEKAGDPNEFSEELRLATISPSGRVISVLRNITKEVIQQVVAENTLKQQAEKAGG